MKVCRGPLCQSLPLVLPNQLWTHYIYITAAVGAGALLSIQADAWTQRTVNPVIVSSSCRQLRRLSSVGHLWTGSTEDIGISPSTLWLRVKPQSQRHTGLQANGSGQGLNLISNNDWHPLVQWIQSLAMNSEPVWQVQRSQVFPGNSYLCCWHINWLIGKLFFFSTPCWHIQKWVCTVAELVFEPSGVLQRRLCMVNICHSACRSEICWFSSKSGP